MAMTDYERLQKYIKDNSYKFKTDEELEAAKYRAMKTINGLPLTLSEFVAKATEGGNPANHDPKTLEAVYEKLASLVNRGKAENVDFSGYAGFGWCLRNPEAIICYEVAGSDKDRWQVNNCADEITKAEAIIEINREWGFEASRTDIIGIPYYTATDYQYIRFDCAHMTWLWKNGALYQTVQ